MNFGDLMKNSANMLLAGMKKKLKIAKIVAISVVVALILLVAIIAGGDSANAEAASNTEGMYSTSTSSWEQFIKFLHTYEGGGEIFENAEGVKCYKVLSDGSSTGSAVGYGVDIGVHGEELRQQGYDTSIGSLIPVDVVDAIESRKIESMGEQVKNIIDANGINLTEYQIYALISRAYNCGVAGALTFTQGSEGLDFASYYKKYWNKGSDNKFNNKVTEGDFSHKLYVEYMSVPVTSGGEYLAGLERRRKSEWTLFQTGYYDILGEYWQESYGSGGEYTQNSNSNYIIGEFTSEITRKTFTIVAQGVDYNGETLFPSQCNRAAGVAILTGYYNGTVEDVIDKAQKEGSGFPYNNTNLYRSTGLSIENHDLKANSYQSFLIEQLVKGNYVLLRFNKETNTESGKWASERGHWISILGYKEEDGIKQIFIGDSGHGQTGWHNIDEFESVKGNIQYLRAVIPTNN